MSAIPPEAMADLQRAQQLRAQSQAVANKLGELRMEVQEHERVVAVLKTLDKSRSCFRLMGEVLVERTVDQVLPELEMNLQQLSKTIENGHEQRAVLDKQANQLMEPHSSLLEELGRREVAGASSGA
jgi:prefoldin subunit 2